jgi:hypothetical protein
LKASLRTASVWWAASYSFLFLIFDLALPLRYFFGLEAVFTALFLFALATVLGVSFLKWRAGKRAAFEHKADLKFRLDVIVPEDDRWLVPIAIGLGIGDAYVLDPETLGTYFILVPLYVLVYVPIRIGVRAARF